MAYAAAVEACVRHTDEAAARLEAFCKRVKPLRAQVEATALSTALSLMRKGLHPLAVPPSGAPY